MKRVLLAGAVAAAFAVAAPIALSQSSESFTQAPTVLAAAPAADASGTPRAAPEKRAFRNPSERLEARLAYMRTALKITDAQQAQWESFANVLRKHARDMDQRFQKVRAERGDGTRGAQPDRRNVTAIERLERTQQRMAQRSARLTEVIAAAKPLYAALSPEQKQVADEMIARQGQGQGRGDHQRNRRGMHRGA